ncbi:BphX family protein [Hydrogenophaga sp.]|uniref:BphX family protein n=1 Tax=Hydrogenophaga sp. TaxID=1904254 RepID=UPI0025BEAB2C|nr:BphX family protein [Hydrogenophaga sp.]MBT9464130.1 BphX family protein [Hydrogenophaga sp.]
MTKVRPFLIGIGLFYIINLIGTLPFSTLGLFGTMYPGVELRVGEPIFTVLQDAWAVVGLQLGAIGVVALWGALDPVRYEAVIPVVIATEVVDSLWDFYSIVWSHEALWFGLVTLAIHVMWIGWGLLAWSAVASNR